MPVIDQQTTMNSYLAFAAGVLSAGIGGELFVRGIVGVAYWARVSAAIIGTTVAAFATSSPELSVAISAALAQKPQISLGDALGSNVANIALILAVALLFSGIQSPRDSVRRDFPIALLTPAVIGTLALDGLLSRLDGLLLLGLFIAWLAAVTVEARKQRSAAEEMLGEKRRWLSVVLCLLGLAFLIMAGRLIVSGARDIALSFGIDEFVIGATVVALGTSLPELATTVVSKMHGHAEVGLGTILGSNIYNGLLIIAVAAIICPISLDWREVAAPLAFGIVTVAFTWPSRSGFIGRRRGILLLALYATYIVIIVRR